MSTELTDLTEDVLHHIFMFVNQPKDMYHAYASCHFIKNFIKSMRDINVYIHKQNDVKVLRLVPNIIRIHFHRYDNAPFDFEWCKKKIWDEKVQYIYINSIENATLIPQVKNIPPVLYGFRRLNKVIKMRNKKENNSVEEPSFINIKEYFMNRFESRKLSKSLYKSKMSQSI